MPDAADYDAEYAAEQIRRSRHPLRRAIKRLYLDRLLRDAEGPTVDLGCGAGQLLRRLPPGSVGIELNPVLVRELSAQGLQVLQARGDDGDFDLPGLPPRPFRSLVVAHVLEHLAAPEVALNRLLRACVRVGIRRVVTVVPGARGFASDPTHRTFFDRSWWARLRLDEQTGFVAREPSYFPGPEWVGRHFVFHETKVVLDRRVGG